MKSVQILTVFYLCLFSVLAIAVPPKYTLTPLGTLGGNRSGSTGINNLSQVVGFASDAQGYTNPFLWENGTMISLGNLGSTEITMTSGATDINDNGQVVGGSWTAAGYRRGFLWQNGTMTDLGTFDPYSNHSEATSINNSGLIAGYSGRYAFIGDEVIKSSSGNILALDINDSGQYVGYVSDGASIPRALTGGNIFGTPGSHARGINNAEQVVGDFLDSNDAMQAFLWHENIMQNLNTLSAISSVAYDINDSTIIVGYFYASTTDKRAFLWQNGDMYDLNDYLHDSETGWKIIEAKAINNLGQIVGEGINPYGQTEAFLLTPIPEPCTLLLLCVGGMMIRKR